MKRRERITGRVVSGARKAADFTRLGWVESQCLEKLGFRPYPGTLNVEVSAEGLRIVEGMEGEAHLELSPPDASCCTARIFPVSIGSVPGALVIPAEEVRVHDRNILEVIAPVRIRDKMGLDEGDEVILVVQARPSDVCLCLKKDEAHRGFPIRAVIFDLDGTLLDTIGIYFRIVDVVLKRLGFPAVPREVIVEAAAEGNFYWDMVLPESASGTSRDLLPRIRTIIEEVSPALFRESTCLIEGADEFVNALCIAGVKIGVVTSTRARHLGLKLSPLKESGLDALFQAVVTADDAKRQKPAPDPLLECAKRIGVSPGECVYVGDMRIDIRAGKAAGMVCVGVLTGFDTSTTLEAEAPDLIVETVACLREKLGLAGC